MPLSKLTIRINSVLNKIDDKNRGLFYIILAVLVFGLLTILVLAASNLDGAIKDSAIKVIGIGCVLIGLIFMMVRQQKNNEYQHTQHHDHRQALNTMSLRTRLMDRKLVQAKEEVKKEIVETKEVVEKKLNGGLHETVKEEISKLPLPTTHEQLVELIKTVQNCDETARKAANEMFEKLKNEGLLKC